MTVVGDSNWTWDTVMGMEGPLDRVCNEVEYKTTRELQGRQ